MKRLIFILLGACSLASCKKFLSEYSQSDIIPKTTVHYGEILISDGYPEEDIALQPWAIFLDDDVEGYSGPTMGSAAYAPASPYQWQPSMDVRKVQDGINTSYNSWQRYYERLLGVNVVLQFINNAEGTQAEKDHAKGQAHALRAFYHFMLVNLYALPYNDSTTTPDRSPGIPLRKSADLSDAFLVRNSVKEVYDLIVTDLDTAVMLLEKDKTIYPKGKISATAAHLLASRVNLYLENWDKAIFHADKVLAVHPQLMDLNTWGGQPDETKPVLGQSNVESIFCYGTVAEKLVYPYGTIYDLSHNLVNNFEADDLRMQTGFYYNPPEFKPFLPAEFSQMKFYSNSNPKMALANSWRSAEAYLNRAEAYIQLYKTKGDVNGAIQALRSLNTLRASRIARASYKDWTIISADQLLEQCRTERRRELYLEEMHRWFDLRRYGMPSITHIFRPDELTQEEYRLEARDRQYTIPIPNDVLMRNPALTQNPQMPGERLPK